MYLAHRVHCFISSYWGVAYVVGVNHFGITHQKFSSILAVFIDLQMLASMLKRLDPHILQTDALVGIDTEFIVGKSMRVIEFWHIVI